MESVIWAFKQLYDKGLAYEGHRVLPYCWRDETPLSNHELRMDDDVYQSRQDPALTVVLPLIGATGDLADASLLIWTTTPWTLPSNLAVAVGPDITYVVVRPASGEFAGAKFVVAEARLAAYARELGEAPEIVATLTGADLTGLHYQPPFRYFAGADNAHQVLAASFVTTEDGTGLVHLAPAFGEDDAAVCAEAGIATVVPVDSQGRFTPEVSDYQGVQVFDANPTIIRDLKERALVVRHETYQHSYPHRWRCRNPLIYKAVSSWFVRVTEFRDRMVELNEDVTWVPEHIKHGQFGKWLSNARDWSISRNRYFGTPIPVWVSDNPAYPRMDVYGSLADLERDFGRLPLNDRGEPDLHRPYIDDLTRPNPDDPTGQSTMRRIPDVLDVWFDSGSMPFAQVHYPFENADWFDNHYPGDFIVEYIGQTRGWFYTLHVLATALFDRPAFRTAVSHGIVLGSDGRKMSKSLRNYPDVSEVLSRDGADAMRWFLMSSPILRGGNLVVTEDGIRDSVRQVLLPVWSTYYFLTMYASAVGQGQGYLARAIRADEVGDLPAMDRYILARTRHLVDGMTGQLDGFDIAGACESVRDYLDELTNWYVRTQRDRFWAEDETAFNTLFTVMETLCRVLAPLAPLVSEEIWRGLTGGRSVHLVDWPDMSGELGAVFAPDDALVATMDELREAVSLALALRKAHALRVRQPLSSLTVVSESVDALAPYTGLLEGELNVRQVVLERLDESAAQRYGISEQLTVNARAAGPRLGRGVQAVIKAAKAGAWDTVNGEVVVHTADGDVPLIATEYDLVTVVDTDAADARAAAVLGTGGFIVLDVALSDELIAEGVARDVIRDVQEARKNAGLNVSDRIVLDLVVDASEVEAVSTHRDLIARETLATSVTVSAGDRKIAVAVTA